MVQLFGRAVLCLTWLSQVSENLRQLPWQRQLCHGLRHDVRMLADHPHIGDGEIWRGDDASKADTSSMVK
jgi:hypothetical protein